MKLQYLISIFFISFILCGCDTVSINTEAQGNNGLAACSLVAGNIKSKNVEPNQKYKRKDCPVCKGKGWYISGDDIEKIDCQYCEPESVPTPEKRSPIILKR